MKTRLPRRNSDEQPRIRFRFAIRLFAILLSVWVCPIGLPSCAAESKKPGASPSDALFDPSRVIQIEIRLDPKDWLALRTSHPVLDEEGEISVTEKGYAYYRGDVLIGGEVVKTVGVRKKGAWGSIDSIRPSLKIKFDEYERGRDFVGLDMLTLNNTLHDWTKAQEFLVYSFMRKAGVPAPRSNLARVIVNGEDLGVYANVESIRKPFIKARFANASGDLYENVATGADLTTDRMHRIAHKWGPDDQCTHLRKVVEVLKGPELVQLDQLGELLDLDAFIRFWAAEVLIGLHDGYAANQNNYYVYRDAKSGKISFIPWGADSAFADRGSTVPKSIKATGYLCHRLWQLPEIRERYRREMQRLLDEVWDEKTMLSELTRVLAMWHDGHPDAPAKLKAQADSISQFIKGRRKEVQAELDSPARDWPLPPRTRQPKPPDNNPLMQIEGSFSAVVVEAFPPPHPKTFLPFPTNIADYFGQGTASLQVTINGQTHKAFAPIGATATAKDSTQIRIAAFNPADRVLWNVIFDVFPFSLSPGVTRSLEPWTIHASVIHGDPHSTNAQFKWGIKKNGTLELTQVSTNLGGTISGSFKINSTAFARKTPP